MIRTSHELLEMDPDAFATIVDLELRNDPELHPDTRHALTNGPLELTQRWVNTLKGIAQNVQAQLRDARTGRAGGSHVVYAEYRAWRHRATRYLKMVEERLRDAKLLLAEQNRTSLTTTLIERIDALHQTLDEVRLELSRFYQGDSEQAPELLHPEQLSTIIDLIDQALDHDRLTRQETTTP